MKKVSCITAAVMALAITPAAFLGTSRAGQADLPVDPKAGKAQPARLAQLQEEYQQTAQKLDQVNQQAQQMQAHLLRLEGAIAILQDLDKPTTATAAVNPSTTNSK